MIGQTLVVLFFLILGALIFGVWLYALISAIKNERLDAVMKLVWVVVIIFVNVLGAPLYLIVAPNRPAR